MCDKVARERWCVAKKGPFCTKQTKDINVRCNRLYSSLHTQVSHAASTHALKGVNNIISKQKRLDNIARPKLLRTPCWRRYFFHGNTLFFTHTQRHVQSHFKQKHILPSRNLIDGHENSTAFIACDIQQVPGSNASDMQRKWSCKETCRNIQASFAQSFLL